MKSLSTNGEEKIYYIPAAPIWWENTKLKIYGSDEGLPIYHQLPAYRESIGFLPVFDDRSKAEAFIEAEGLSVDTVEILEFTSAESEGDEQ